MKKLIVAIVMVAGASQLFAQEYKVAKGSGKLDIQEVNNVTIEGYTGNEIVFSSLDSYRDKDKRAEGLRAISANGVEDNTGLGLSVQDRSGSIEVRQLRKMDGPRVKIMVPKGVTVYYRHTSPHGSDLKIRNFEGAIEVSTVHNGVHMENVSGPLDIRTVHGEIETELNPTMTGPLSFSSQHGLVDISVPLAMKANVTLSSSHGEIFVDPALKLEVPKSGDWVKYGGSKVNGTINGGGLELSLSSSHGNLYLRKKP